MTNENPSDSTPEHVAFGSEPAAMPGRARRTGRAVTWVAVGAIGATVLTGVAFAATNEGSTETPSPSAANPSAPAAPGEGRPGGGPGGRGHGGLFGGLKGDVLHGEFVVKQDDGSTKTMLGQTGEVTAASTTSLTVKSTDGFTATWSLSSSTTVRAFKATTDGKRADGALSDLKAGQTVTVVGTKSTDTTGAATSVSIRPTAAQLAELQKNAPNRDRRGPGHMQDSASTPSASASAAA